MHMEVSAFAQLILCSDQLQDKLFSPARLSDQNPLGMARLPDLPARASHYKLAERADTRSFPKAAELDRDPRVAAEIFHFFANHELLALELMAWVLLKYPDLPKALRLRLATTMIEEQSHMRLYLEQMHLRGMDLGELPMGSHFWNVIAKTQNPMEFLAGMSLTFEQANLDFAKGWRDHFSHLQMEQEAQVMHTVYEDEISHVKHGLLWLRELGPKGMDDFALHQHFMPAKLSIRKAKTESMDIQARLRAGLSMDYIEQLKIAGGSKSRSPDLVDLRIGKSTGSNQKSPLHLDSDCAQMAWIWSSSDDLAVVPNIPSTNYQHFLHQVWGSNPVWILRSELGNLHTRISHLRKMELWSWAGGLEQIKQDLDPALWPAQVPQRSTLEQLDSKSYAAQSLASLPAVDPCWDLEAGSIHHNSDFLQDLQAPSLIKINHGSSGQGRINTALDPEPHWRSATEELLRYGPVVCEALRPRILDLSALFYVEKNQVRLMGVSRFDTDQRGTWRGSYCHVLHGLPSEILVFLHQKIGNHSRIELWTEELKKWIESEILPLGFQGPLGIDALIWKDQEGKLWLRPLVEINARMSFGHIALRLRKKVPKNIQARLRLRRLSSLRKQGYASALDYAQAHPLQTQGEMWTQGVMPLCDPRDAKDFLPVLEIGELALLQNLT